MATTPASPPPRKAAMAFIFVTIFLDVLGIGIIIPILPELVKSFVGGSTSDASRWYGALAATYACMQFLCAPILGALSDRFGRRPVLLGSLFGLGIDYLIQGFAPSIWWLFIGRLLAGVMGASLTTANAYIADISTPENRARNYGLMGVAFGLGFIIGPASGGLLGSIDLRLPFFVSAGLALVNWCYGLFVLPESLDLAHRDAFSWRKANPVGSVAVLRRYPLVAGLGLGFAFITLAQRGLETTWVLYTGHRYGWDERTNGLTLALVGVMAVIVQGGLVRPVVKRFGERRTLVGGLSVAIGSHIAYGLAPHGWMVPLIIVVGSLSGLAGPAIQGLIAGEAPPADQGKIQGALTSIMSFTSILAPLLFVAGTFSYFTSPAAPIQLPGAPFFLGSALAATSMLLMHRLFRRYPEHPPAGNPSPTVP
jgi:DHA1 family tetracycline resistance protein-like MFS transporter